MIRRSIVKWLKKNHSTDRPKCDYEECEKPAMGVMKPSEIRYCVNHAPSGAEPGYVSSVDMDKFESGE